MNASLKKSNANVFLVKISGLPQLISDYIGKIMFVIIDNYPVINGSITLYLRGSILLGDGSPNRIDGEVFQWPRFQENGQNTIRWLRESIKSTLDWDQS